jgi:hypothetical protein
VWRHEHARALHFFALSHGRFIHARNRVLNHFLCRNLRVSTRPLPVALWTVLTSIPWPTDLTVLYFKSDVIGSMVQLVFDICRDGKKELVEYGTVRTYSSTTVHSQYTVSTIYAYDDIIRIIQALRVVVVVSSRRDHTGEWYRNAVFELKSTHKECNSV